VYLVNQPGELHEIIAYRRYLDVMSIVLFKMQVNNKNWIIWIRMGIVGWDEATRI